MTPGLDKSLDYLLVGVMLWAVLVAWFVNGDVLPTWRAWRCARGWHYWRRGGKYGMYAWVSRDGGFYDHRDAPAWVRYWECTRCDLQYLGHEVVYHRGLEALQWG